MEDIYVQVSRAVAADASARVNFFPPTTTGKWKLKSLSIVPNETSATNASNYADLTMKKGSTALMTARSTNASTGAEVTQGTGEAMTLTGTGTDMECTLAAPHHLLIDCTPGTGVAVDISILAVYQQLVG